MGKRTVLAGMMTIGMMVAAPTQAADEMTPRLVLEDHAFGRNRVQYEHESPVAWGSVAPRKHSFWLVPPASEPAAPAPLCVVLHSAGGGGLEPFQPICEPHFQRGWYGDESFYVLSLECRNDDGWWWGASEVGSRPDAPGPTERRVLATVEWVASHFPVDRNRIYLNGISMGGSGTLGIGMNHGDIFAAAGVIVPAGVEHWRARFCGKEAPEPPPLLNISSQADGFAKGQEELLAYFREHRYAVAFAWVPSGHAAFQIGKENPQGFYDYPWLSIRKDAAYPVFTGATSDNRYPGLGNTTAPDQEGQINLQFRWRNVEDSGKRLAMELWLAGAGTTHGVTGGPTEATAEVTFRRVQRFPVKPGAAYAWRMTAGGQVRQEGRVTAAEAGTRGLIILPGVRMTHEAQALTVVPVN